MERVWSFRSWNVGSGVWISCSVDWQLECGVCCLVVWWISDAGVMVVCIWVQGSWGVGASGV